MAKKYNCERNGKKYFKVSRVVGHKADGKPIVKVFYGDGEKDAIDKANQYLHDLENGYSVESDSNKIADLMKFWLFKVKLPSGTIKPSTFSRYEGIYSNYIVDSEIAYKSIKEVRKTTIQLFYNNLYNKGLRSSQIYSINKVLKTFFAYCVSEELIPKNPCIGVSIPKDSTEIDLKDEKLEILTPIEVKTLKEYFKSTNMFLLFITAISTGLRQGELLALTWDDIDLVDKEIRIYKTYKRVYQYDSKGNKELVNLVQAPKTKTSYRVIPISSELYSNLTMVLNKQGYLFSEDNGLNPISARKVAYYWYKALKQCNIPHLKFHALRHTFASSLLASGVDIKSVSELLGHSTIITTQIYLHSTKSNKKDAINKIDCLFNL